MEMSHETKVGTAFGGVLALINIPFSTIENTVILAILGGIGGFLGTLLGKWILKELKVLITKIKK